ncbi:MAG: Clp domain protein [Pedosphaera sp.]|nr:Clp domain protein [Pedosphaera sp.]
MFELEKAIAEWRLNLLQAGIENREVLDELETHLRDRLELLKPHLPDAATFQAAVSQIGELEPLKREFAKLNRSGWRDNPITLRILAAWFILFGLDAVWHFTHIVLHFTQTLSTPRFRHSAVLGIVLCGLSALLSLQIFVGMGLLRRSNFWRGCVFAYGIPAILAGLGEMLFCAWMPAAKMAGDYSVFMGVLIPMRFVWVWALLKICMMMWGFVFLTRPTTRNLFRSAAKTLGA